MEKAFTIDDIARELGVSKTTVSRAMSGKGRISAETREKVLAFIESHDFRPNAAAKSLAESRTYNLGLVIPGGGNILDLGFFQECAQGVCQVAAQNDYDVLVSVLDGGAAERLERILAHRKVDGIVAARSEVDSPILDILRRQPLPFVIIGGADDPAVIHVDNNNRRACRDMTALLLARGLGRMALLGGSTNHRVTHSRRRGFEDAYEEAGLVPDPALIFLDICDGAGVSAAVTDALRLGPDCIVCMDDYLCSQVLAQLRERRVRVPQDVRVACFYDSSILEHMSPPVTSLRFNAVELGRVACRELLAQIEGRPAESRVLPEYQLLLRDSTN